MLSQTYGFAPETVRNGKKKQKKRNSFFAILLLSYLEALQFISFNRSKQVDRINIHGYRIREDRVMDRGTVKGTTQKPLARLVVGSIPGACARDSRFSLPLPLFLIYSLTQHERQISTSSYSLSTFTATLRFVGFRYFIHP